MRSDPPVNMMWGLLSHYSELNRRPLHSILPLISYTPVTVERVVVVPPSCLVYQVSPVFRSGTIRSPSCSPNNLQLQVRELQHP